MADGSTMPASLQALAATRHEQAGLAREINAVQAATQALLQSGAVQPGFYSEALQAQHDKLRDLYERAYKAATEEARLANDVISGSRACLRRRERERKAAAARLAAEESASEEESEADEYEDPSRAAAAASASPPAPVRPTMLLSRFDKLNIWSYDPSNPLQPGSEVAALTDQHSIPPLWIQCKVKRYLPGARPKYEVVDEDAGEAAGGGMEEGGDETQPAAAPVPRQKLYTLDVRKIIPLPSLALVPLSKRREFPRGTRVIAVFPTGGITTLYPAEVIETPRTNKRAAAAAGGGGKGSAASAAASASSTDYVLMFDDDEECHRPVNAQFVAPIPEMLAAD